MKKIDQLYKDFLHSSGISTDTRDDVKNKLFFSLSGENFNGNKFAQTAIDKGALLAVVDDPAFQTGSHIILVDNVLETLQQLALFHRKQINIPVIGITGTNGKTTTKELIASVLGSTYNTVATKGNLNNHIGVPLTLLQINNKTEIAVIEMGANHPGEISTLCSLALPTHGIITNIGKAHLEGFGNFEGVKQTKKELYDFLEKNKKHAFVNADDPLLGELSKNIDRITYGTNTGNVTGKIIKHAPFISVEVTLPHKSFTINSKLYGSYNFPNIMAAIAVGNHFSVSADNIRQSIEKYIPDNNRSQQITTKHNNLILDAYNANPVSMLNAIISFEKAHFKNSMLILGDMFELGDASKEEHQKIVDLLLEKGFKNVLLAGKAFYGTTHPFIAFETTEQAAEFIQQNPLSNKTILIKGSRGMHLETLVRYL